MGANCIRSCCVFHHVYSVFLNYLLSYVKISDKGLECRLWPKYGVRCTWNEVERLGKFKGIFSYDVLYLKSATPFGLQTMMFARKAIGLNSQYFILLTGIQGWPNGGLKDDLRNYLPKLLKKKENKASNKSVGVKK